MKGPPSANTPTARRLLNLESVGIPSTGLRTLVFRFSSQRKSSLPRFYKTGRVDSFHWRVFTRTILDMPLCMVVPVLAQATPKALCVTVQFAVLSSLPNSRDRMLYNFLWIALARTPFHPADALQTQNYFWCQPKPPVVFLQEGCKLILSSEQGWLYPGTLGNPH